MAQWDMTVRLENRAYNDSKIVYDARRTDTRVYGKIPAIRGDWQFEWEIRDFGRINDRDWPLLHKVGLVATKTNWETGSRRAGPGIPVDPAPLWLRTQGDGYVDLSNQLDDKHYYWIPHPIVFEYKGVDGRTYTNAYIRLESMLFRNHFLAFEWADKYHLKDKGPLILRSDGPQDSSEREWDWLYYKS